MLRLIASFLLTLVFTYGIAQTQTLEVKSTLNTQYNLNDAGDKVMVVTYQRDAGAPVVVAWQSNDPKATLKGHTYTTAALQSSRRTHLDLFGTAADKDASVMWISNINFE